MKVNEIIIKKAIVLMGFFGILINKRSYHLSKKENHQILLPKHMKVEDSVEKPYPIKLSLFCLAASCITLPFYLGILRNLSNSHQSGKMENSISYFSIEGASVIVFFIGIVLLLAIFFHYVFTYDKKPKNQQNADLLFFLLGIVLTATFSSSYIFNKSSLGFTGAGILFISFITLTTIIYKNIFEISIIAFDNFMELEKGKQMTIALSLITFMIGLLSRK